MATTIQVSKELLKELQKRKLYEKESYEELIWDLLEDTMELSAQTKKDIEVSMRQIKQGKTVSWEQVNKEARL